MLSDGMPSVQRTNAITGNFYGLRGERGPQPGEPLLLEGSQIDRFFFGASRVPEHPDTGSFSSPLGA